jgi:phosphoglycolate phosphatase-like HAD superfamily hydrolase
MLARLSLAPRRASTRVFNRGVRFHNTNSWSERLDEGNPTTQTKDFPVWPHQENETIQQAYEILKNLFKGKIRNPEKTIGALFDFDGTLGHTIAAHDVSFRTTHMEFTGQEPELNSKEILEALNGPVEEVFKKFVGEAAKPAAKFYHNQMDIHYPEKIAFMPNAAQTVAIFSLLRQGGMLSHLAIGSFMVHDRLNKAVEKLGIKDVFDSVEGLKGEGKDKDTKEFITERIYKNGPIPHEVGVWGDAWIRENSSDRVMARNIPGGKAKFFAFGKPCGHSAGYQVTDLPWFPNCKVINEVTRLAFNDAVQECKEENKSAPTRLDLVRIQRRLDAISKEQIGRE